MSEMQYGRLATVIGRYYAMDRDNRWERVKLAYDALMGGQGEASSSADVVAAVQRRYEQKENDEFLKPIIVDQEGVIREGDTLVFIDFRADRMREIVDVIGHGPGDRFASEFVRRDLKLTLMSQYNSKFKFPLIFPPQSMENVLAEWLSKKNVTQ
jgi:2,3-bisphosphoglycerate-independent phosphoglycerate mutase